MEIMKHEIYGLAERTVTMLYSLIVCNMIFKGSIHPGGPR